MGNLCTIDASDNGIVVIMLPEKMTMANSEQIQNELKLAGRTGNTILDFGAVNFCDSSGLSVLVRYYKTLNYNTDKVILCNINQTIMSLLELTRLVELFIIVNSVFEAKQILSK